MNQNLQSLGGGGSKASCSTCGLTSAKSDDKVSLAFGMTASASLNSARVPVQVISFLNILLPVSSSSVWNSTLLSCTAQALLTVSEGPPARNLKFSHFTRTRPTYKKGVYIHPFSDAILNRSLALSRAEALPLDSWSISWPQESNKAHRSKLRWAFSLASNSERYIYSIFNILRVHRGRHGWLRPLSCHGPDIAHSATCGKVSRQGSCECAIPHTASTNLWWVQLCKHGRGSGSTMNEIHHTKAMFCLALTGPTHLH